MQAFFTQHWQLVVSFISLLFLIIGILIKQKFNSSSKQENNMEDRMKEIEEEVKEMKDNYIERFELVMEKLGEIAATVSSIETKVDTQKEFCQYIQNQKK